MEFFNLSYTPVSFFTLIKNIIGKSLKEIIIFLMLMTLPSIAFGAVQCYCRGQYYNFNDDRNCRDWCLGSQTQPSSPQPSYTPSANDDNSWQQQQQQREEEERQRKIAEEEKRREEFLKKKQEGLKEPKDSDTGEFGPQGIDEGGNLGIRDTGDIDNSIKQKEKAESKKFRKEWQKALGCAMKEIYDRAEKLGPAGHKFSAQLQGEMAKVFNEVGQPVHNKDDVNIINFDMHREAQAGKSSYNQFAVNVVVSTHDDGTLTMSVESYLSKSAGKKDKHADLQSILRIDQHGKIIESETSKAVKKCLAR
jgi:hypothetical protein